MAKSKNNIITHGLSGKVGDILVFRQRAGQTIVSKVPVQSGELTENQKAVNRKFQQAVIYAKASLADASLKAAYAAEAEGAQTGYNIAIADFFHAPDISEVDFSAYAGQPGDKIKIRVSDNFMVKEVRVAIMNSDGTIADQGIAANDINGLDWIFTATEANPSLEGDKIIITATDNPDNKAVKEQLLAG